MSLTEILLVFFVCTLLRSASVHGDVLGEIAIMCGPRQKAIIVDEKGLLKLKCVCQDMFFGKNCRVKGEFPASCFFVVRGGFFTRSCV